MELIPTILDQLHSEVIVKTALSAAKSERWLEIPFHKLFVLAATGNSWFVGKPYLIRFWKSSALPAQSNLPIACSGCVWSWAKEERHPDVPRPSAQSCLWLRELRHRGDPTAMIRAYDLLEHWLRFME